MKLTLITQNSTKNYRVYKDELGNIIAFSYAVIIGKLLNDGDSTVLLNEKYLHYSVTTSKHISKFLTFLHTNYGIQIPKEQIKKVTF
jgi:hypothetical protein